MTLSIAIVDVIGLAYDGATLSKRGLGGSESAVIMVSKELQKIGFDVTVYNNCNDSDCSEGIYDGVKYIDIKNITEEKKYDVMISSRTFIPFVPEHLYSMFQPDQYGRYHDCASFKKITSDYRIMWMHDTFCMGDEYLEDLLRDGTIHELFTLSDFHTTYVTNNEHGRKRIFEVMKEYMWQTRNGINLYHNDVDLSQKDKNLFVYNASVSKGMKPLVTKVWPKIKEKIPHAKLTIIGGYYRFRENAAPDEQELEFKRIVEESHNDITFTGIITQQEIANIYARANMFLYPSAFPETFGISTLESLAYNTPLVASKFGALEETAIREASYFVDYAIEPTPLSPQLNTDHQVNMFVDTVINAYNNPYLHQQKQNYCNIIKDVVGWDTVVLQWKQHIFKKLKMHLPLDEYQQVSYINNKVHEVFSRRITNLEEFGTPKLSYEKPFTFIVPFYNSENYLSNLVDSIASQDYANYKVYFRDDFSTDNSVSVLVDKVMSLPPQIRQNFVITQNYERKGALFNQVDLIRQYAEDGSIIILLDGDDSLYPDNKILDFYNNLHNSADFTYGSCWSMADNIPLVAQNYPAEIKRTGSYRQHKFNWGIPYTHLRTFKKDLFNDIPDDVFKDENGKWFMAGGDNALFYEVIERTDPNKVQAVQKITCMYNDINPLNDYKVNGEEQNRNATAIQDKYQLTHEQWTALYEATEPAPQETPKQEVMQVTKKKILIAIPTAKYIEPETFKSIYDLEVPEGYETEFQFFYGYRIDQIRNLISNWVVNGFDYLFSVDSDMIFEKDTLKKLIKHDKDMVSGIYRQRKPEQVLEIFFKRGNGYHNLTDMNQFNGLVNTTGLAEINGCGFGCVLIKRHVFEKIGYPYFEYHSALDHANTVSEDVDFCIKAANTGTKIYADTTIICKHRGETTYEIGKNSL